MHDGTSENSDGNLITLIYVLINYEKKIVDNGNSIFSSLISHVQHHSVLVPWHLSRATRRIRQGTNGQHPPRNRYFHTFSLSPSRWRRHACSRTCAGVPTPARPSAISLHYTSSHAYLHILVCELTTRARFSHIFCFWISSLRKICFYAYHLSSRFVFVCCLSFFSTLIFFILFSDYFLFKLPFLNIDFVIFFQSKV